MKETNFKQTEIGLFPNDWIEKSIQELGPISKGKGISRAECGTGLIPCVRYGEIYTDHDNYIKSFRSFISTEVAKTSRKLNYGELLFTGSGETKEDIGKCVAYVDNIEAYAGGDIIIVSPDTKEYDPMFLGFLMNDKYVINQKALRGQGDAVVHITGKTLGTVQLVLPPLNEQRRISKTLCDIDNLISSLCELIEKKKNIKQGSVQQILTGKKRLKGFSEPWIEKKLGEMLSYEQPANYLVHSTKYVEGGTPVLTAGKSFILGYTNETFGIYDNLPVIIFDDFTTDSRLVTFPFKAKSSAMKMLQPNKGYDARLLYELLQMIDYTPGDHQRHWIGMFSDLSILVPPTYEEQLAISNILKDMDNEISSLEAKKEKYESIKKGMMQELLTGKIRLI